MNKFAKYDFISDKNRSKFEEIFGKGMFKELHMDTYLNDPYMLLSRAEESSVKPSLKNGRAVLHKKDGIAIMNIVLDSIENCAFKQYAPSHYQILFEVHNILYKLLIIF